MKHKDSHADIFGAYSAGFEIPHQEDVADSVKQSIPPATTREPSNDPVPDAHWETVRPLSEVKTQGTCLGLSNSASIESNLSVQFSAVK